MTRGRLLALVTVAALVAGIASLVALESWVKDRDARRLREQAQRALDTPIAVDCAHLLLARDRQTVVLIGRIEVGGSSCGGLVHVQYRDDEGDARRRTRFVRVRGRVLHTTLGTVLADAVDVATP